MLSPNKVLRESASPVVSPSTAIFDNQTLTVKEAAAFLKMSERMIYKKIGTRSIPFRRIGRNIRFYAPDLIAWIRQE
jgi:excisionase family DNA binding protein